MPPDALSLPQSELPEEIEKAIEQLVHTAFQDGILHEVCESGADGMDRSGSEMAVASARSALTAAILSRLGEAEAERDEVRDQLGNALRRWVDTEIKTSAALARVERLEKALEAMLKPFPCVSGPPEDALEDWMAAVSRFRAAARSALSEAQPQGDH